MFLISLYIKFYSYLAEIDSITCVNYYFKMSLKLKKHVSIFYQIKILSYQKQNFVEKYFVMFFTYFPRKIHYFGFHQ